MTTVLDWHTYKDKEQEGYEEPGVSTVELRFSGGLGNHIFNYNFAYILAKIK